MDPSNDPADPLDQSGDTATRLRRLELELHRLKLAVEKENRGFAGWAKRWGPVLALFIAVFAVPRGFTDAYHVLWSRPNTELVRGSTVVMGYDPATQKVSFLVDFGATNTGTKADFVRDLRGSLKNNSVPAAGDLPFGISDIECSAQGTKVNLPFPIVTSVPTSMACTIASHLSEPKAGPFAGAGSYRLAMSVGGLDASSQTLDFCFYMGDQMLREFLSSQKLWSARFLYPDCDQGGNP